MNSADNAARKRPATAAELSGNIGADGIPMPSWKNDLSLALPGREPRLSPATYVPATWDGITGEPYPSAGQFPQVNHYKVWEDN